LAYGAIVEMILNPITEELPAQTDKSQERENLR
jgi:hypothetical protein